MTELNGKTFSIKDWLPLILAAAAFLFNAGISYSSLSRVDAEIASIKQDYVRKDVVSAQLDAMQQRLVTLEGMINRLDGKLDGLGAKSR